MAIHQIHQHRNIGKDVDGRDRLSELADRRCFLLAAALAVDALQQLMLLEQPFDLRQRRDTNAFDGTERRKLRLVSYPGREHGFDFSDNDPMTVDAPRRSRFARDLLVEGDGFEPSVPREGPTRRDGFIRLPAEARKRTIGGRRFQPRDLGGDLRRDHNLRDDNDRLGWGRRQAQNGGSPDGGPMVRIHLPPAASPLRTRLPSPFATGTESWPNAAADDECQPCCAATIPSPRVPLKRARARTRRFRPVAHDRLEAI